MSDTWMNKKPTGLTELTREWALSAMTPRYQQDGTVLRTLTPPTKSEWSVAWVGVGIACLVLLGAVFTYPLWRS